MAKIKTYKTVTEKLSVGVEGLKTAFKTEPTLTLQIIIGTFATLFALILSNNWLLVKQTFFLTIAVILAELINTSIEYLCDLVEPNINPKVKKIKDIVAGVVLVISVTAIFITVIDFYNVIAGSRV